VSKPKRPRLRMRNLEVLSAFLQRETAYNDSLRSVPVAGSDPPWHMLYCRKVVIAYWQPNDPILRVRVDFSAGPRSLVRACNDLITLASSRRIGIDLEAVPPEPTPDKDNEVPF
jgi:hypothetical protein